MTTCEWLEQPQDYYIESKPIVHVWLVAVLKVVRLIVDQQAITWPPLATAPQVEKEGGGVSVCEVHPRKQLRWKVHLCPALTESMRVGKFAISRDVEWDPYEVCAGKFDNYIHMEFCGRIPHHINYPQMGPK